MKNDILKRLDAFIPKNQELYKLLKEQSKSCDELIHDICMEYGENGVLSLENEEGDYDIVVIYDGGNHPEYASNICSTVYSVKACILPNPITDEMYKGFEVDTEDTPNYESSRLDFFDKDAILDFIVGKYIDAEPMN